MQQVCVEPQDSDAVTPPIGTPDTAANDTVSDIPVAPLTVCEQCLAIGSYYQFTELALQSVAGGNVSLTSALNATWASDMSKGELSVFMRVEAIEGNNVTFRLVSGARVGNDGDKCLVQETEVDLSLPLTTTGMGPSLATDFYVYAGSKAHPKNCNPEAAAHAIPVVNLVANITCSGVCAPPDADILEGSFTAALAKEDLLGTCVCLDLGSTTTSDEVCGDFSGDYKGVGGACDGCGEEYAEFGDLIPAFNGGGDLDWGSCKETVGADAACLTAGFKAKRIPESEVPTDCP
jgi:hypothetical protein